MAAQLALRNDRPDPIDRRAISVREQCRPFELVTPRGNSWRSPPWKNGWGPIGSCIRIETSAYLDAGHESPNEKSGYSPFTDTLFRDIIDLN